MSEYYKRVELHAHSRFSEDDGITDVRDLLRFAAEDGQSAVAITDHMDIHAWPEMTFLWKDREDRKVVRPIYGMEAYVIDDLGMMKGLEEKKRSYHTTVLVKDEVGKRNLYKLLTYAEKNANPRTWNRSLPLSVLLENREGLLLGSGCEDGWLLRTAVSFVNIFETEGALRFSKSQPFREVIDMFDFLEVQPTGEYQEAIKYLIDVGEDEGVPVVATGDVHYLRPEDALTRKVHYHVLHNWTKEVVENMGEDLYFRTTEEMLKEFDFLPKEKAFEIVVENTNKIAEKCMLQEISSDKKEYPFIEQGDAKLRFLCEKALPQKYDSQMADAAKDRMEKELQMVSLADNSFLFLHTYEVMRRQNLRGCDVFFRGLLGNSILAYLLDITTVDPLEYNLEPELIYGENGMKALDININVPTKVQKQIFEDYAKQDTFEGLEKGIRVGATYRVGDEQAEEELNRFEQSFGVKYKGVEREKRLEDLSGISQGMTLHPCGVMLVPKGQNIEENTPIAVFNSTDPEENNKEMTYFNYWHLDRIYLKMDWISHVGCDMLSRLADLTGMDVSKVDFKEDAVIRQFTAIDENGRYGADTHTFEFDKEFIREVMKRVKPQSFEDLVKVTCLVHGTNSWTDNGEILLKAKKADISDIISNRDDVMEYLMKKGIDRNLAFRISEAVRKGIVVHGKCSRWPEWTALMQDHDVPDWFIWSCEQISYLFPRAHGIAYTQVACRLVWYKLHYPDIYEKVWEEFYGKEE